ncbi:MAG: CobW family GTP-binding protein [Myxococcota bacterium]
MSVTLNVVTGILGSGKTTVLRHLVEGPTIEGQPAVVVGEYAEQGFDADMLRASGAHVVQISGVSVEEQPARYVEAVRRLVTSGRHGRVWLETSGVTHISRVAKELAADPEIAERARIGRTTTVLDAGSFHAHDRHFAPQLWGQVAVADVVIVNKTDKAHEADLAAIRDALRERHPRGKVLLAYMGQVRRQEIMAPLEEEFRPAILDLEWGEDAPAEFEAFVYRTEVPCFDRVLFGHQLLNLPGGRIARFKGVLKSYDRAHCVNGMPGQLDWDNTPVEGDTAIAFIGFDLEARRESITALLDAELKAQMDDGR